jgi:hypothetical protein
MARWQPRDAKGEMDTLGCDPAMGGKDKFVMAPRHGTWFDQLIRVPGIEVPDGQTGAALVVKHRATGPYQHRRDRLGLIDL